MARLDAITAIGRPVDPRHPTNRAIILVALALAVAGSALRIASGSEPLDAAVAGLVLGGTGFLAWALGRELDPDHPYAAFVGVAVVALGSLHQGLPSLLPSFWALLLLRLLNRTCGPPATWLDSTAILAMALLLVHRGLWVAAPLTAVVFALDATLPPTNRKQFAFAGATVVGTVVIFGIGRPTVGFPEDPLVLTTIAITGLLHIALMTTSGRPTSHDDRGFGPLEGRRVRTAQAAGLLIGLSTVTLHGTGGWAATLPLWAAMLGLGASHAVRQIRSQIRPAQDASDHP